MARPDPKIDRVVFGTYCAANMKSKPEHFEVIVIGGGLSGLCAALQLGRAGVKTVLLNRAIENTENRLGGFARFSGAKFSLPPAGMGLLPVVGSHDRLIETVSAVLHLLKLDQRSAQHSGDVEANDPDQTTSAGISTRIYGSIVLSPSEIGNTIDDLSRRVAEVCTVLDAKCLRLVNTDGDWHVLYRAIGTSECNVLSSTAVFFAGGRSGSNLLIGAGCEQTNGKGLDLGVRVEFPNRDHMKKLRALGPDAKILSEKCRTFCLNVPGKIHPYNFESLSIPGGVVADATHSAGNVGLLYRHPSKEKTLPDVLGKAKSVLTNNDLSYFVTGEFLGSSTQPICKIYGSEITAALSSFGNRLEELDLLNWKWPHYVHIPLLDWHWPTFSMPGTFRSSARKLYVLGDSSGHARGLLQAAASGYIAAQEYLA